MMYINCFNTGSVFATKAGGLIGHIGTGLKAISNCFNVGLVECATGNVPSSVIGGQDVGSNTFGVTDIAEVYYLDRIPVAIAYDHWANGLCKLEGNFKTEQYMKSREFVTLLNQFVSSYESEDESVTLRTWKYNEGDYPTFN